MAGKGIDSLLQDLYINNGFPHVIHEVNDLISDLRIYVERKELTIDETRVKQGLLNILEQYNEESIINKELYKRLEESIWEKYSR